MQSNVANSVRKRLIPHILIFPFMPMASAGVARAGAEAMHEAFGLRMTYCFELTPNEYHTNVVFPVLAARACVLYPAACAAWSPGFSEPL
jgi:hypothetical protein